MLDEVGPSVLIVVLNCFEKRLERNLVINEGLLIDDDVVLLDVTTKAQHVSDSGHCPQLQFHYPILNGAQFLSALAGTDDLIKIDLSSTGGNWSHPWLEPCRDAILCEREPLKDLLSRKVDVDVIAKINSHNRQTEFGNRLHSHNARDPIHHVLDGKGDELFD